MNRADTLNIGAVDRAAYRLPHLLRELPRNFSAHLPVSPADRATVAEVRHHAENANDTLMHGLAALGHVIMNAGLNVDGEIESRHLARLGDLITHLAVEAEAMQELMWSTGHALDGAGWTPVDPASMPPPEQPVIGWDAKLENVCVVFYDVSGPSLPNWRACNDGREVPFDAITHWQHCAPPKGGQP